MSAATSNAIRQKQRNHNFHESSATFSVGFGREGEQLDDGSIAYELTVQSQVAEVLNNLIEQCPERSTKDRRNQEEQQVEWVRKV